MKNSKVTYNEVDYGSFKVYNWTLNVTTKQGEKHFLLGQDEKFCRRSLRMYPKDVINKIGGANLDNIKIQKSLGRFIVKTLGLTESIVDNLQPWDLCCQ